MADPRDDMTELELMNAGVPRITVTPEPPSLGKPWGESGRLFEPDLSPAAPPAAQADADLGARLAGQYRGGGRLPPDAAPTLPVERHPLGLLPRPEDLPDLSRPPQPWQGQSPRVRAAPTTPEEDFGRALGQVGQPAPTNRVYNALTGAVGKIGELVAPAIPPELRPKAYGALQAATMLDPLQSGLKVGPAVSEGKYGEAAMNLLGAIPGEGIAAGVAKIGGAAAASKAMFIPVMNSAKRAKAAELEKAGATPEQLWSQMQVVRGKDNILREEVSDLNARFIGDQESIARRIFERNNPNLNWADDRSRAVAKARADARVEATQLMTRTHPDPNAQFNYEDVLHHPELYARLKKMGLDLGKMPVLNDQTMAALGQYYSRSAQNPRGAITYRIQNEDLPGAGTPTALDRLLGRTPAETPGNLERGETFKTLLHEGEHAIANYFGMAKGASGDPSAINFSPIAKALYDRNMQQAPKIMTEMEFFDKNPNLTGQDYKIYKRNSERDLEDFKQETRKWAADEAYRTSHGEGWARIIPERADFTAAQRKAVPPTTQFYPRIQHHTVEYNQPWDTSTPSASQASRPVKPGSILGAPAMELFHVAGPEYRAGQPLRSLYAREGDQAYATFAERWPDAGDLGLDHAHKTFFYPTRADATRHAEDFGGTILQVDPRRVEGLRFERTEPPGYWVTNQDVPPDALYPGNRDWLLIGSGR